MVFGSDRNMSQSEPLRQLLHFRMRVGALIGVVGFATFSLRHFIDPIARAKGSLLLQGFLLCSMLLFMATFALLHRHPKTSMSRLRQVETVLLGVVISVLMLIGFDWFDRGVALAGPLPQSTEDALAQKIWALSPSGQLVMDRAYRGLGGMLYVSFGIAAVGYGVLIPNTWRRCLFVQLVILLSAESCLVRAGLLFPALRPQLPNFMFIVFYNLGVFAAIGLYGCYKLTVLREQAQEAREVGPYVLKQQLGKGGMGEVYLAQHRLLRRPCAVKIIRASRVGSPVTLARFEREVQATAQLSHPNTIEIYDFGRTEEGTLYYAMEYLPGSSLDTLVRRHGPLPPGRVIYLLRQVCRALREAHGRGLIHRDIKPANIYVTERGGEYDVVKLLDFGLVAYHGRAAKQSGDIEPVLTAEEPETDDAHITMAGHVLGTPAYMSPEQARGAAVDARCDIYCLGAVAFFALTGRPPYDAGSFAAMLNAHKNSKPRRPSKELGTIPPDLDDVVLRCLSKKPDERYDSASELDAALGRCRSASEWNARCGEQWWQTVVAAKQSQQPDAAPDRSGQNVTDSADVPTALDQTAERAADRQR